jgi:murein L,D-transpeptidase YcbB/YkuD
LGRAISEDKWDWLTEYVRQLGIYLRDVMKLPRVDFEWWNEPTKLQGLGFGWDKYCKLGNKLAIAWHSVSKNYKFYAFADDLINLYYLKNILTDKVFMSNVDVISTHCGVAREDDEWNANLIATANGFMAIYPHLKQSVSELTCNGIISRLNQLPGNTIGYGHIGLNRHLINGNLLGTRMDDYAYWDDNLFRITAPEKIAISAKFNHDNYKAYEIVEDDIMLEEIYENGSRSIGVTFIQKVLNEDIDIDLDPKLKVDGWFGDKTENAVKLYQKNFNLEIDGRVGEITFKSMIFNNQNLFDELMYDIHR